VERLAKQFEAQLQDLSQKMEETVRHVADLNGQKSKLQSENSHLLAQLEDAESQISAFAKTR
jgi:predicted  nucleic acid-binding Zn-ribbon protein